MKKDDIEFLKDLQHELRTQENDGNASPVYWGVIEESLRIVPDGYGDGLFIVDEGKKYTIEEFTEIIECDINCIVDDNDKKYILNQWKEVDKEWICDIVDFYNNVLDGNAEVLEFTKGDELSFNTGAFLTKRACNEYIDKYGYNHNKPRTFAMTAYRNFELERLLNILTNLDFDDIKVDG